jgi:hypothetical protein
MVVFNAAASAGFSAATKAIVTQALAKVGGGVAALGVSVSLWSGSLIQRLPEGRPADAPRPAAVRAFEAARDALGQRFAAGTPWVYVPGADDRPDRIRLFESPRFAGNELLVLRDNGCVEWLTLPRLRAEIVTQTGQTPEAIAAAALRPSGS